MDYAATDLLLAIFHHLLVFTLAGILAFEIGTVSVNMQGSEIQRVGRVDLWYGILAGVIIIVGFLRATVAAKGWAYYSVNLFFWLKIATFLVIGLLSIPPTVSAGSARLPPMPRSAPIRTPSTMSAASSGWRRCCSSCSRPSPPPWPAAMANWHEVTRALMFPLFPMGEREPGRRRCEAGKGRALLSKLRAPSPARSTPLLATSPQAGRGEDNPAASSQSPTPWRWRSDLDSVFRNRACKIVGGNLRRFRYMRRDGEFTCQRMRETRTRPRFSFLLTITVSSSQMSTSSSDSQNMASV